MIVANDITELIGKTPMVRINRLTGPEDATVYAKLEWYNIGGSVKDRMALYLMEYAEASGRLSKDKVILEATSGNTGIALAMLAAAKGYRIAIVMPESVSVERRQIIRAYGAELILSPGNKGTSGAIEWKKRLLREDPEKYVDLDQFRDPANILAHYQTTGREILEQTQGIVDMVVVGIGTAGTGVGVSMRLKEFNKEVKIVGVTTQLGVSIQGLRNPKEPYPTMLFRRDAFDEIVEIDEEGKKEAFKVVREIARKEGLLVGMSSGAIMLVALKKARELGRGKTIVAVLPDGGEKYLSTGLFD
ncbi:MAG: PLP-dependent cysteine synthase family protein [Candidatus Brockarchaeota archaeon]|nr:PLP-dependent cysteine synthase family protein [Candidatus Brockarchaeota archaeon]